MVPLYCDQTEFTLNNIHFPNTRKASLLCTVLILVSGCTDASEPKWNAAAKCAGLTRAMGEDNKQLFDFALKIHPTYQSDPTLSVAQVNYVYGHSEGATKGVFLVGGVNVKINGKVADSPEQLATHYYSTNNCELLVAEAQQQANNLTASTPVVEKRSPANAWKPITTEVITNGKITMKASSTTYTIEFDEPLDYPSLWVDGKRILYSQNKYERSLRSGMPIFTYFQYGSSLEIRHSNNTEHISLKGWTAAWKQAGGYVSSERPKWHIEAYQ